MKKFVYIIFATALALLSSGCEKITESKIYTIEDFKGQWGSYYDNQLMTVIDVSYTEPGTIILASATASVKASESESDKIQLNVEYEISDYEIDKVSGKLIYSLPEEDGSGSYSLILCDGNLYQQFESYAMGTEYKRLTETVEYQYPAK